MKLSTKGRYGTRALLDIALHYGKKPVQLKSIAERQGISKRYLEQIITPLIASNILVSTRGTRGGIMLARKPSEIKLIDFINVLEGPVAPVDCVSNPGICKRSTSCVAREVWNDMAAAMSGVLESITLQDLVERQREKSPAREPVYDI